MATFYVSATGSDSANGTSAATAFKTLAKAQAAMAASSGADTTLVESGTYTAGATLTSANSGDTIKADTGATAVIDGGNTAKTFFTISGANNVTISGLTFQNTSTGGDNDTVKPAILVSSGTGEKIQSNTFKSLGSAVIFNGGSGLVDGNTITDMGSVAIRLKSAGVTVSNNTISHSSYDLPEGGAIEMLGAGGDTITHNTIDDSAFNGIWDESAGHNQITWNKVTNSVLVESDGGGIYAFAPSSGDTIANNYVVNSLTNSHLNWGIYLDDNVNNTTVTGNYAQGTMAGFDLHGGDSATVTNNVFVGSSYGFTTMGTGDGGSIGFSDNTNVNHNLVYGQNAMAAWDTDGGTSNSVDSNVYIGSSSSQWGFDPQTYSQHLSSDAPWDSHSLLDSSFANEWDASSLSIKAGSQAAADGIVLPDLSQAGAGGTSTGGGGTGGGGTGGGGTGGGGTGGGGTGGGGTGGGTPTNVTLELIVASTRSGTTIPQFIVKVDGAEIGTGTASTKYPREQEVDIKTALTSGQHSIDITYTNDVGNNALWVNDIGIKAGSAAVQWTQDNWVKLANTGDTMHATFTV